MIIIETQIKNSENGRSDLTTVGDKVNFVLIKIKRDKTDIMNCKEIRNLIPSVRYELCAIKNCKVASTGYLYALSGKVH